MRVFATVLLGVSLTASPLLARNGGETAKEDTPVAATSTSTLPDKPAAVKPEASAIEREMQDLRGLIEEQRAELEAQRTALKAQQLKMEALEEKLGSAPSEPAAAPAAIATTSAAVAPSTPASTASDPIGNPAAKALAMSSWSDRMWICPTPHPDRSTPQAATIRRSSSTPPAQPARPKGPC